MEIGRSCYRTRGTWSKLCFLSACFLLLVKRGEAWIESSPGTWFGHSPFLGSLFFWDWSSGETLMLGRYLPFQENGDLRMRLWCYTFWLGSPWWSRVHPVCWVFLPFGFSPESSKASEKLEPSFPYHRGELNQGPVLKLETKQCRKKITIFWRNLGSRHQDVIYHDLSRKKTICSKKECHLRWQRQPNRTTAHPQSR